MTSMQRAVILCNCTATQIHCPGMGPSLIFLLRAVSLTLILSSPNLLRRSAQRLRECAVRATTVPRRSSSQPRRVVPRRRVRSSSCDARRRPRGGLHVNDSGGPRGGLRDGLQRGRDGDAPSWCGADGDGWHGVLKPRGAAMCSGSDG
jgi:hypothetical protein